MKSAKGKIKRIHVLRLEPGEDVLESICAYCREHELSDGAVLSGIGSLDGCSFLDPVELPGKPGCYGYGDPIDKPSPLELTGLSGMICSDPDGSPSPHIHASFSDGDGNEYGGHLREGNKVLITVEVAVVEFDGIGMKRAVDPVKGVPVLSPEEY